MVKVIGYNLKEKVCFCQPKIILTPILMYSVVKTIFILRFMILSHSISLKKCNNVFNLLSFKRGTVSKLILVLINIMPKVVFIELNLS